MLVIDYKDNIFIQYSLYSLCVVLKRCRIYFSKIFLVIFLCHRLFSFHPTIIQFIINTTLLFSQFSIFFSTLISFSYLLVTELFSVFKSYWYLLGLNLISHIDLKINFILMKRWKQKKYQTDERKKKKIIILINEEGNLTQPTSQKLFPHLTSQIKKQCLEKGHYIILIWTKHRRCDHHKRWDSKSTNFDCIHGRTSETSGP